MQYNFPKYFTTFHNKNLWESPGDFDNREIIVVIHIIEVHTSYLYAARLPHY